MRHGDVQKNNANHDQADSDDGHHRQVFAEYQNPREHDAHGSDPGPDRIGRTQSDRPQRESQQNEGDDVADDLSLIHI